MPRQLLVSPDPYPASEFPLPKRMPSSTGWCWAEKMIQRTQSYPDPEHQILPLSHIQSILVALSSEDQPGHLVLFPELAKAKAHRLLHVQLQKRSNVLYTIFHHAYKKLSMKGVGHRCVLPPEDTIVSVFHAEWKHPAPGIASERGAMGEEEDLHQLSSWPDLQEECEGGLLPRGLWHSPGLLCCWNNSALHKSFKPSQRQCEKPSDHSPSWGLSPISMQEAEAMSLGISLRSGPFQKEKGFRAESPRSQTKAKVRYKTKKDETMSSLPAPFFPPFPCLFAQKKK